MDTNKLHSVGLLVLYAIGQIALLVCLELLVSIVKNTNNHTKRVVVIAGLLFIFIGFIMLFWDSVMIFI